MLHYSKQAFEDGYDFSALTFKEQEMTKYLYISADVMNDLYYAIKKYKKIKNNLKSNLMKLNNDWSFERNGYIYGYIVNANKHPYNENEFILNLLVNDECVKNIKFHINSNDVIWVSIREICTDTFNIDDLIGSLVRMDIFNSTRTNGLPFSYIKRIDFFSEEEIDTLYKMINIMLEQADIEDEV